MRSFYFPLDWRGPVRPAIKMVRPAAVIIVETEIWPISCVNAGALEFR